MNEYQSPLVERYASREMVELFSPERKFRTWRKLWIALAVAEKSLGLKISPAQIRELRKFADKLNLEKARRYEKKFKHDVMAHIHAYGDQCPKARSIIHLGATSMYVVDNTDVLIMRDALASIRDSLVALVQALSKFAKINVNIPTVAFTHFQPAQFTTVGRRACLWLQDVLMDLDELDRRVEQLRFLGVKGATGTQASFLALFDGKESKVKALDDKVSQAFGFRQYWPVSGQTYPRKVDSQILSLLAGIGETAHKFSNDMRLLQHLGEMQEPWGKDQVGSSAMAYKRNPMKAERITSLSRFLITLQQNASFTAASQWFERTLDDSAGKRIVMPEAFLAADAILSLMITIVSGMEVNRDVIRRNVERELPFVATENLMMAAVRAGGDRQHVHERVRRHALAASENVRNGKGNDLLVRLDKDEAFSRIQSRLKGILDPVRYVGRSVSQVREFLNNEVQPRIRGSKKGKKRDEIRV